MTTLALIFTLCAIGIAETRYLIEKRLKSEAPVCFLGEDCQKVLGSRYNKILGIHNDILGLLFYLGVGILAGILVLEIEIFMLPLFLLLGLGILTGALMSIYFTFLQGVVIRSWCFWCLMSAGTTWAMTAIYFLGIYV